MSGQVDEKGFGVPGRRDRDNLRPFVPPASSPRPPVEDLVEEGVLIAVSGIRMAVKNRAIVRAIREDADFDIDWYLATVRAQMELLSAETDADVRRFERDNDPSDKRAARFPGESERIFLRRSMLTGLAQRLRELATDDGFVRGVAIESRDRALEEIGDAITSSVLRSIAPLDTLTGGDRLIALQSLYSDLEQLEGGA
jgi:hypothetical protein